MYILTISKQQITLPPAPLLKELFPAFMFIHKKNELFLYYCAWQSELGHQGSKVAGA